MGCCRLKSGLFNWYVIVVISDVFGHHHADLQSVTPALAHDCSVNYSTAPRPKRRGFKLEKKSRKGCDRLEKKTTLLLIALCYGGIGPAALSFLRSLTCLEQRQHETDRTWLDQTSMLMYQPTLNLEHLYLFFLRDKPMWPLVFLKMATFF